MRTSLSTHHAARLSHVATMVISTVLTASCHHQRSLLATALGPQKTEHCWWSVNRSLLPPDSVAAHFQRAYTAVGFTNAGRASLADTAWAYAGPTAVRTDEPLIVYSTWAVAYRVGDSTHYRYFNAWDGKQPARTIPLCIAISNAAAIHGVQLPAPTGEESLSVWRRRP